MCTFTPSVWTDERAKCGRIGRASLPRSALLFDFLPFYGGLPRRLTMKLRVRSPNILCRLTNQHSCPDSVHVRLDFRRSLVSISGPSSSLLRLLSRTATDHPAYVYVYIFSVEFQAVNCRCESQTCRNSLRSGLSSSQDVIRKTKRS